MNRHLTSELLSAYLDSELGFAETQRVETHCQGCEACRSRLTALRRVASGLAALGTVAPPAALRAQIRRQVAAQPLAPRQRWLARLRWLIEVPTLPVWRHSAAFLFLLVASAFLINEGADRVQQGAVVPGGGVRQGEHVETYAGVPPLGALQTTTGEIDGLKFVWTEGAGWVQKGLEGERPNTSVDVTSPQGRELLRRFNDLQVLLADGDSVVLRYNLETVEIRSAKSGQNQPIGDLAPAPPQRERAALDLGGLVV